MHQKGFTPVIVIIIVAVALVTLGGAGYFVVKQISTEPVACTEEVKLCPDGSAVGRVGPKCEFAPCPILMLPPTVPPAAGECRATGCSGQICSDEDVITTCEFKPEYACYMTAKCERQPEGRCGWTMTPELKSCLLSVLGE